MTISERERQQRVARYRVLAAVRKIQRLMPLTDTDPGVVAQVDVLLNALSAHIGQRDRT